jgi:hypothetical protein
MKFNTAEVYEKLPSPLKFQLKSENHILNETCMNSCNPLSISRYILARYFLSRSAKRIFLRPM